MRIEVRFKDDVAIMSLSGKFLAGSDGPFRRQKVNDMIDAGARKMAIDFSEVPYIDSSGLGFLAGSRVTTQNAGVSLVLAGMNQHVRRILDGVRLTSFFALADDEAGALTKINEGVSPDTIRGAVSEKGPKKKRSSAPAE